MTELKLESFGEGLNVAIIGASGAIGQGMIQQLNQSPNVARIYACSRGKVASNDVHKMKFLPIDLLDEQSITDAAERITEPLDLVIVTTGILHMGEGLMPEKSIKDFHPDHFARIFAINTTGPAMIAKYFLPEMAKNRKNVFAVLSARVGSISDNRPGGWYAYRASKAALNMCGHWLQPVLPVPPLSTGRKVLPLIIAQRSVTAGLQAMAAVMNCVLHSEFHQQEHLPALFQPLSPGNEQATDRLLK